MSPSERVRAIALAPSTHITVNLAVVCSVVVASWMASRHYMRIEEALSDLRANQWTPNHEAESWRLFLAANRGIDLTAPDVTQAVENVDKRNRRNP